MAAGNRNVPAEPGIAGAVYDSAILQDDVVIISRLGGSQEGGEQDGNHTQDLHSELLNRRIW